MRHVIILWVSWGCNTTLVHCRPMFQVSLKPSTLLQSLQRGDQEQLIVPASIRESYCLLLFCAWLGSILSPFVELGCGHHLAQDVDTTADKWAEALPRTPRLASAILGHSWCLAGYQAKVIPIISERWSLSFAMATSMHFKADGRQSIKKFQYSCTNNAFLQNKSAEKFFCTKKSIWLMNDWRNKSARKIPFAISPLLRRSCVRAYTPLGARAPTRWGGGSARPLRVKMAKIIQK